MIRKTREYINKIQAKPYLARKRLMWFLSIVTMIIIVFFWTYYLKGNLQGSWIKSQPQIVSQKQEKPNVPSLLDNIKSSFLEFIEFLKPKPKFDEDDSNDN